MATKNEIYARWSVEHEELMEVLRTCPRPTRRSWYSTQQDPARLKELATQHANNWALCKIVLLHKDCPDEVTEAFLQSTVWYERLVAALAKHKRAGFITRLFNDADKRCRAPAYKTAIDQELAPVAEVARLVIADTATHCYFREGMDFWSITDMRRLADGTATLQTLVDEADARWNRLASAHEEMELQ